MIEKVAGKSLRSFVFYIIVIFGFRLKLMFPYVHPPLPPQSRVQNVLILQIALINIRKELRIDQLRNRGPLTDAKEKKILQI